MTITVMMGMGKLCPDGVYLRAEKMPSNDVFTYIHRVSGRTSVGDAGGARHKRRLALWIMKDERADSSGFSESSEER